MKVERAKKYKTGDSLHNSVSAAFNDAQVRDLRQIAEKRGEPVSVTMRECVLTVISQAKRKGLIDDFSKLCQEDNPGTETVYTWQKVRNCVSEANQIVEELMTLICPDHAIGKRISTLSVDIYAMRKYLEENIK